MTRLVSVNVGVPREIPWRGKTVYTSLWKEPVSIFLDPPKMTLSGLCASRP
jgi:hypothetical protein